MPLVTPAPPVIPKTLHGRLLALAVGEELLFQTESEAGNARTRLRKEKRRGRVHKTRQGWLLTRIE